MRKLDAEESGEHMRWPSGDTWPAPDRGTVYDPTEGWPAAVWGL
jgi:ATP/maltotriose-dependent transcriptional regulator MalT